MTHTSDARQDPEQDLNAQDPERNSEQDLVARLNLEPHPEGGSFRRTYTAGDAVATANGERPAVTLIHFFLRAGESSEWHVVSSDEIWLWHGPGAFEIEFGGSGERPQEGTVESRAERRLLAAPGTPGGEQQILVPAGVWQRTIPSDTDALVSCMVTPGFDFADWRLAEDR